MYDMSSDEIDALIDNIRDRRLNAVRIHAQALADAKALADEKASASLWKQCEMLANNIERLDKAIEATETRAMKIRALRLELGLE